MNKIPEKYNGKKVVITGGLGMIGSTLAHKLVDFGANVTIIDNYLEPYGANDANIAGIENKVKINIANICDKSSMKKLLQNKEIVFSLAGQVGHNISMKNPELDMELNCLGQLNTLQACSEGSKDAKILFAGSRFQFGHIYKNPVNEDHPTAPLSIYAIHKLTGENYYQAFNKHYGMDTVVFRIANPYGPRSQMKHHHYSMVNWFLRQAMEEKDITVFGDGKQLRDYIYVDDLANAFLKAGVSEKSKGQIYNVGSGTGTKFIDMVHKIVKIVGKGKVISIPWPEEYEKVETGDYVTDIKKIQEHLNWFPEISFEEGLERTFKYYKEKRDLYWKGKDGP